MDNQTREGGFSPWVIVFGGFVVMALLHSMIQTCFSLFMSPVVEEMQVSRTSFSFCTSLVAIATALLAPFMGPILSDVTKGRRIFLFCIIGMGLSYISYAAATRIWHMYISAALVGIFSCGAISMPISIIINNWFTRMKGIAMSIALAGSGLGGSIITPLLTNLIAEKGWRAGFVYFGLAMIVIEVPVVFLFMPHSPELRHTEPFGGEVTQPAPSGKSIPLAWLKKQPFFYVYLVGMFAVSFVGYGSLSHLSVHITDNFDANFSNAIISFFLLILTPSKIALGWIYDKIGAKAGTIIVMTSHAASFAILQFAGSENILWIMAILYSVGISNGTVAPSVVTAILFGSDNYGAVFGYVYSFCMLGMVLGSPFLALVYNMTGSYYLGWATCMVMCLLSIACLVYAVNRCQKLTDALNANIDIFAENAKSI